MGNGGQNIITGLTAQADITLLYLLQANERETFQEIIIEGDKWEDFTLVFDNHIEDFEVKWYSRPISFSIIKKIIDKEKGKELSKKEKFVIIVKNLGKDFKDNYYFIRNSIGFLYDIEKNKLEDNSIGNKLLKKGWDKESIKFLIKTKIIELQNEENVQERIKEFLSIKDPFYLQTEDQRNLFARCFRNILEKGKSGGSITQKEFKNSLEDFKENEAKKSESFTPELSVHDRLVNLDPFLEESEKFKYFDNSKYLTPLSSEIRLIIYISKQLKTNNFKVEDIDFFIRKILLKRDYINLAMNLLKEKWDKGLASPGYLLGFLEDNFGKLFYDFILEQAFEILMEIAKFDNKGKNDKKILEILINSGVIKPFKKENILGFQLNHKELRIKQEVAELMEIFYNRIENKKEIIDFIFEYFNLTSLKFSHSVNIPPKFYSLIKDYILQDYIKNFRYIIEKITRQFNYVYKGNFEGYEFHSSVTFMSGSSFSICEREIVRLLFEPLFKEIYSKNEEIAWVFFKKEILEKKEIKKENPIFIKRSLIEIIIDRIIDCKSEETKLEAFSYLKSILNFGEGHPTTSEMIFSKLTNKNLKDFGLEEVMELIESDSDPYPTNVFVVESLVKLISDNYEPAKDYILIFIKNEEFIKWETRFKTFQILLKYGIATTSPNLIARILNTINIEGLLNEQDPITVQSLGFILAGLISKDWENGENRGKNIIDDLLKGKTASKKVLKFLGGTISSLSENNPFNTFKLFEDYLRDKETFRTTFKNDSLPRERIADLVGELSKIGKYKEAKQIIELCIDDPDPETHNRKEDFNYHLQVKKGGDSSLITSVRGRIAYSLKTLIASRDAGLMEYGLKKTLMFLDLEGKLAEKLNYPEPDYYVRTQALHPLIFIAWNKHIFDSITQGFSKEVEIAALKLIEVLKKDSEKPGFEPKGTMKWMIKIFEGIRENLSLNNAKRVIDFFVNYKVEEIAELLIYFAIFRDEENNKNFDSKYFKETLKRLCKIRNEIRYKISWHFFKNIKDSNNKKEIFYKIEPYFKLLFEIYNEKVFIELYQILKITLNWEKKYESHKELIKKAILKETQYIKDRNKRIPILSGINRDIFDILYAHDKSDFLEVFHLLLENLGEEVNHYGVIDGIKIFKSISEIKSGMEELYEDIKSKLIERYPDIYCT